MTAKGAAFLNRMLSRMIGVRKFKVIRENPEQRDFYQLAYWTIRYVQMGADDPAGKAILHLSPKPVPKSVTASPIQDVGVPPAPKHPALMDGRSEQEWSRSVAAYLAWRMASAEQDFTGWRQQPDEMQTLVQALGFWKQLQRGVLPFWVRKDVDERRKRAEQSKNARSDVQRRERLHQLHRMRVRGVQETEHSSDRPDGSRTSRSSSKQEASGRFESPRGPATDRSPVRIVRGPILCVVSPKQHECTVQPDQPKPVLPALGNAEALPEDQPVMTSPEIFAELVKLGRSKRELTDRFWGEVVVVGRARYGRNQEVAKALSCHWMTVSRWTVASRKVLVDINTRALLANLAALMVEQEPDAEHISIRFERELAEAALAQSTNNKSAASRLLQVEADTLTLMLQRQPKGCLRRTPGKQK